MNASQPNSPIGNPQSCEPMRDLSKRAPRLVAPKPYGQRPPPFTPAYSGSIPLAFRSVK